MGITVDIIRNTTTDLNVKKQNRSHVTTSPRLSRLSKRQSSSYLSLKRSAPRRPSRFQRSPVILKLRMFASKCPKSLRSLLLSKNVCPKQLERSVITSSLSYQNKFAKTSSLAMPILCLNTLNTLTLTNKILIDCSFAKAFQNIRRREISSLLKLFIENML